MYRQSPGRIHRSKGIKIKNVLQVCLLLAVCFWLIYQVKHSHDKKKEFDESDSKSSDDLTRLGRKARVGGTLIKDEQSDDDEINGEEVDENKHEEDEVEVEDKKVDLKEDDDETDEHEEEKSDVEEEKEGGEEREDGEERESHDTDSEDGQVDKEKDGEDSSTREEHYKADDASSAVTQNRHTENILEVESKGSETKIDLLGNSSSTNNDAIKQESIDGGLPSGNLTENVLGRGSYLLSTDLGHANNSISDVENARLDSNSTVSDAKEFPNSSNNSAVEAGNNTETLLENNSEIEGEKSDTSDENLQVSENPEEVEQDGIDESDASISLDEKKVRTDLETLPEIQTEGANSEEDAAE